MTDRELRAVVQQAGRADEETDVSQSPHLNSTVDELTAEGLVRLIIKKHLPHVDRLKEFEKRSNVILDDWNRSMQVLLNAAEILRKIEQEQRHQGHQAQAQSLIPEQQLSRAA